MIELPFEFPEFLPGWVWLAGAGPGDPGLVTLLAAHALSHADVIVYDALVGEDVMKLARPSSVREFAGKRGGLPSPTQRDISLRLIDLARQDKRVLRLKGGDPLVFGRGGEEALALVAAGIPFRLVPGITAGIGGLAYAGIPATHRDTNSVLTFITAHAAGGAIPRDIDWRALAKGSPVLVIYMALRNLGEIAAKLIAGGRSPDEPAALVSHATMPTQRVVETTLGDAARVVEVERLAPPAFVVVGEVVRFRSGLDWLGTLAGRRLNPNPLGLPNDHEAG